MFWSNSNKITNLLQISCIVATDLFTRPRFSIWSTFPSFFSPVAVTSSWHFQQKSHPYWTWENTQKLVLFSSCSRKADFNISIKCCSIVVSLQQNFMHRPISRYVEIASGTTHTCLEQDIAQQSDVQQIYYKEVNTQQTLLHLAVKVHDSSSSVISPSVWKIFGSTTYVSDNTINHKTKNYQMYRRKIIKHTSWYSRQNNAS
jgi:hypothetical protein